MAQIFDEDAFERSKLTIVRLCPTESTEGDGVGFPHLNLQQSLDTGQTARSSSTLTIVITLKSWRPAGIFKCVPGSGHEEIDNCQLSADN